MESNILEVVNKERKTAGDKAFIINSPDFKEELFTLKETDDDWNSVSRKLSNKFKIDVSPQSLQNKFTNEMSMTLSVDGYANKQFTDHIKHLSKRYEQTEKLADKFLSIMNNLIDRLVEVNEGDLEAITEILEIITPYEKLNKALMMQLQFVRDEQDKITKTMSANKKQVSDEDIKDKVYKMLPDILKMLEMQGKISIIEKSILK